MIKVSVIVPVYNGERHLTECMDSICGQTLQDIEIICVDDGSTDQSMQILQEYQNQDNRVQIYQQDHKYAGVARNLGMSHATGEYLTFWDCDDFFDLQALDKLYKKMREEDADVGVCGCYEYLESKQKSFSHPAGLNMKRVPTGGAFNRYTNPEYYLSFTNEAAWNKIFKHEYIEKLGLQFQTIRNGNDAYFTEVALGLADRIVCINENLITYRIERGYGLVSSVSEAPLNPIQAWIDIAENLERHEAFGVKTFANKALGSMIYMLSNLHTWEAFSQAVTALQTYGLQKMHIVPRDEKYYGSTWHSDVVNHLYTDSTEEFAIFLSHFRYIQLYDTKAELRDTKSHVKECNKEIKKFDKETAKLKSHNDKLENENRLLKQEVNQIRNSWTFKIGKTVTWVPSHLKKLFQNR